MTTKVWDYDLNDFKEVPILGKVMFVGKSFFAFRDGKTYDVIDEENGMFRVKDESEEDFLYAILNPKPLSEDGNDYSSNSWKIVDDPEGKIAKAIKKYS